MAKLQLVQDPAADALLESNPFALLVGMLLDQQYPMEAAFAGPKKIADRIGGVDAREIADYNPEEFAALCSKTPAIHRFPGSMAKRVQTLAQIIVDQYDGEAAALWTAGDPDGAEVLRRLKALPGIRRTEGEDFPGTAGQAVRRDAEGMARSGRGLRQGRVVHVGGRREGCRIAGEGAVVQEADEGGGEGRQGLSHRVSEGRQGLSIE